MTASPVTTLPPDPGLMPPENRERVWQQALLAAMVLGVDPAAMGGIVVNARAGPVRDAWLAALQSALDPALPLRRMTPDIADGRLLGGLDLAATLATGRPVSERGLLAEADGGIIILPMAERIGGGLAARLAAVMDSGEVTTQRDGVNGTHKARLGFVALNESMAADEAVSPVLTDRFALSVTLDQLRHDDVADTLLDAHAVMAARARLADVSADPEAAGKLCRVATALGIASVRRPLMALGAARIIAALAGHDVASDDDLAEAAALVLAPYATQIPEASSDQQPQETEPEDSEPLDDKAEPDSPDQDAAGEPPEPPPPQSPETSDQQQGRPPDDVIIEAAKAAIPVGLLALLKSGLAPVKGKGSGRTGKFQASKSRGRIIGARPGDPASGARLDVVETLRAAAPWQRLRRQVLRDADLAGKSRKVLVQRSDFRVSRHRQRTETTTIFVVDASGSSALQRLAEAKGAVRTLLAECYIRRDEVALFSFRGQGAELVLPPTRSLVRAERLLAAMPAGGPTPFAGAINAATAMADAVRRKGRVPSVIFMTDGRANIGLEGRQGRPAAHADAKAAAKALQAMGLAALIIDTSARPSPQAEEIAADMGARYLPLPRADDLSLGRAVSSLRGA
jgi:magnesium chelatase subunit D